MYICICIFICIFLCIFLLVCELVLWYFSVICCQILYFILSRIFLISHKFIQDFAYRNLLIHITWPYIFIPSWKIKLHQTVIPLTLIFRFSLYAEFQKDDLWEKNEFFKFKTILNIRRSSLVAIIWFEKRWKNHWRSWPLFCNGMLFITLTNSVQLKSAEICFGLTSFAN